MFSKRFLISHFLISLVVLFLYMYVLALIDRKELDASIFYYMVSTARYILLFPLLLVGDNLPKGNMPLFVSGVFLNSLIWSVVTKQLIVKLKLKGSVN